MGSLLSLPSRAQPIEYFQSSETEECKRLRMPPSYEDESNRLIPSLPHEVSLEILARVPRICYLNMKMVSRNWKAAIIGSELYQLRKELGRTEEWLYILTKVEEDKLACHALDPLSGRWQKLPPMPTAACEEKTQMGFSGLCLQNVMDSSIKIADIIRGWLGRRDASLKMQTCGCASGAVDGCLYVLGGFSRSSATKCVWRYDPCANLWHEASPMTTGRAFCKTSLLDNKLYVVGGISRVRGGFTPLQSAEVYDPQRDLWTQMPSMPFSKAKLSPTPFLAELLKPVAIGVTSYRGRLCVPQSLYSWPLFVDVRGEIYDPGTNTWVEMPAGMGEGWPAKQAGTKLSAVLNNELYALDPFGSLDGGQLKVYDHQDDAWKVVIGDVPVHNLSNCETPYLLASFLGKLHLIAKDINNDASILQADLKRLCCSYCTSSSSPIISSSQIPEKLNETEPDFWEVIATKNFGTAEFVSCQVLSI
ncbi:F-box/kelch-repeat protein [Canna indica]|uniref:F-box/kelch-repeat protein n=1 Tax=Canna indica TaxID=4628 RepID=A0AAQ3JWC0_9LILI|nr:F-box/kelch-repeat protein [Canna indica]